MLPTEQFSGDATQGPVWTPEVWRVGPEALVTKARAALFQNERDLEDGVLGGGDTAMSGSLTSPQNEVEQVIGGSAPAGGGRSAHWGSILSDLRRTEPLAAWANGEHTGPANPPA